MTLILAVIGLVLVILEVVTASTFFIWIAIGFFAACIVSLFTTNVVVIAAFGIVVTVLSVSLMRTKYAKYVLPQKQTPTAYNELIGNHAIMQADYTANGVDVGTARVGGNDWSVQSEQLGNVFFKNERVVIKKIEGVRLIIEKEE